MDSQKLLNKVKELTGLTWEQLANRLGYSNGRNLNDVGKGRREMRGASAAALKYFAQGVLNDDDKIMIPEFTLGDGYVNGDRVEILNRNHYPRFIAKILAVDEIYDRDRTRFIEIDDVEALYVFLWIDRNDENEAIEVLKRARKEIVLQNKNLK